MTHDIVIIEDRLVEIMSPNCRVRVTSCNRVGLSMPASESRIDNRVSTPSVTDHVLQYVPIPTNSSL
ncbi:unnamed protein product [Mycena citricolor]|uniref:Uncharacterized protein n=1 Tax=Mycena citricolor TaxID=2018698 RepID=A0AAD2JYJ5_9AGAR|nr:unnamed protein product [Mycena citricolor]